MNISIAKVVNGRVINCLFLQPINIAKRKNKRYHLSSLDELIPWTSDGHCTCLHDIYKSLYQWAAISKGKEENTELYWVSLYKCQAQCLAFCVYYLILSSQYHFEVGSIVLILKIKGQAQRRNMTCSTSPIDGVRILIWIWVTSRSVLFFKGGTIHPCITPSHLRSFSNSQYPWKFILMVNASL